MRVTLSIEHGRDKTKKMKRIMWVQIKTDIEGLGTVSAVSELPDDTPLAKEIETIVTRVVEMKKQSLLDEKKANEKSNVSKKG